MPQSSAISLIVILFSGFFANKFFNDCANARLVISDIFSSLSQLVCGYLYKILYDVFEWFVKISFHFSGNFGLHFFSISVKIKVFSCQNSAFGSGMIG